MLKLIFDCQYHSVDSVVKDDAAVLSSSFRMNWFCIPWCFFVGLDQLQVLWFMTLSRQVWFFNSKLCCFQTVSKIRSKSRLVLRHQVQAFHQSKLQWFVSFECFIKAGQSYCLSGLSIQTVLSSSASSIASIREVVNQSFRHVLILSTTHPTGSIRYTMFPMVYQGGRCAEHLLLTSHMKLFLHDIVSE